MFLYDAKNYKHFAKILDLLNSEDIRGSNNFFYKYHFVLTLLLFSKRSTQFDKWETSCIITELNLFTTKQIQQKRKGSVSFTSSIVL